jgi:uncharacterized protein (TIGR03083 family)
MPLADPSPIDTRALFRPVSGELIMLLRALKPADWERPTVAGTWVVRDVVAHLVDVMFRRLSFDRDRMKPPPPSGPISSDRDFADFINGLNAQWITAAKRFSSRVLTDLFERASADIADWFEGLSLNAPAHFGVSWAGEQASEGWFDIGREFTELWHHQEQIRMAVGVPSLADSQYLHAVLDISVRGLPHAFRDTDAEPGQTVVLDVSGSAGGQWTLTREVHRWKISAGVPPVATTRIRLRDDVAWKLLFNVFKGAQPAEAIRVEGLVELGQPFLRARSVIV